MKKTHEIILNNKSTYVAIGELNSGNCKRVANDEGYIFTSMTDAAKHAGVAVQNMWHHLQPNGPRTCKGHVYWYVDKRDESFGRVMNRLAETTAENERRKADEEDARKWREYQAEQERIRKAEEERLENERKEKEKRDKEKAKADAKVERCQTIRDRIAAQLAEAERNLMTAQMEREALDDEEDVA